MYTQQELFNDQILIGRLIKNDKVDKAKIREHMELMFKISTNPVISAKISGMLFMFDLCFPRKN